MSSNFETNRLIKRLERRISNRSYHENIAYASGKIFGEDYGLILGNASGLAATGTDSDLWSSQTIYTGHPTTGSPELVSLSSTDAADTQDIQIYGLDGDYRFQKEVVTLNGLSNVSSRKKWWRVFKTRNISDTTLAGTVVCRHAGTVSNVFTRINDNMGESMDAVYTVPAGKRMVIYSIYGTAGTETASDTSIQFWIRARALGGTYLPISGGVLNNDGPFNPPLKTPLVVESKSDIVVRIDDISDNDSDMSMIIEYELI